MKPSPSSTEIAGVSLTLSYLLSAVILAVTALACRSKPDTSEPRKNVQAEAPSTPDRLAPGELAEGEKEVFGFRVPQKMRILAYFGDAAHLSGRVTRQSVADYVRRRVIARHAELEASRIVFPQVRIKGDKTSKLYRFEVLANGLETRLVIKNITPVPAAPGLSEEERWRRAGLTPEGEPLPHLE